LQFELDPSTEKTKTDAGIAELKSARKQNGQEITELKSAKNKDNKQIKGLKRQLGDIQEARKKERALEDQLCEVHVK
jgi:hypothetical protein